MLRSETLALREIDRGIEAAMSDREAAYWRQAVADPCGCTEGLLGGLISGVSLARRPVYGGTRMRVGIGGFVVGALAGKAIGVARGLRLVRYQRQALTRRVDELERLQRQAVAATAQT
jgi:hypothetical protein